MRKIKPSPNPEHWPRKAVASIECRPRDLIIRIADWTRQAPETGEPGYDVEVYIGGVYDYHQSKTHTLYNHGTKERAKVAAVAFARAQIAKLL